MEDDIIKDDTIEDGIIEDGAIADGIIADIAGYDTVWWLCPDPLCPFLR